MTATDRQYENLLQHIIETGAEKDDRTGTGTYSVFGPQLRYNLADGFPLITTKKVHTKSIIGELLWFLSGDTNANTLRDKYGVTIWEEWAESDGYLGPIYGKQWRAWEKANEYTSVDQITTVIENIRRDPDSRRHIVSAWNVGDLDKMALSPCHALFQFYVANGRLSCQLYQRSADMFLGTPFNIASYALLTHMVAAQTGLDVGEFIWTAGDAHLYRNHLDQAVTQISRDPRPFPTLHLADRPDIFSYQPEDITITGYDPHPRISAPVAV